MWMWFKSLTHMHLLINEALRIVFHASLSVTEVCAYFHIIRQSNTSLCFTFNNNITRWECRISCLFNHHVHWDCSLVRKWTILLFMYEPNRLSSYCRFNFTINFILWWTTFWQLIFKICVICVWFESHIRCCSNKDLLSVCFIKYIPNTKVF